MSRFTAKIAEIWYGDHNADLTRTIVDTAIMQPEPCKQSLVQIMNLREENARLKEQLMSPKASTQAAGDLVNARFQDNLDAATRRLIVEEILKRIDDTTVVYSGPALIEFRCESQLTDTSKSVGGVFVLVNPFGLNVTPGEPRALPLKTVYSPDSRQPSRDGTTATNLDTLRTTVMEFLNNPATRVLTAPEGVLNVACHFFSQYPAILYGRKGIKFSTPSAAHAYEKF